MSATLGWEQSEELLRLCAATAGFDVAHMTRADACSVFDMLSGQAGIVGVTARFARTRIDALAAATPHRPARSPTPNPAPKPPPSSGPRTPAADRAALLRHDGGDLDEAHRDPRARDAPRAEPGAREGARVPHDGGARLGHPHGSPQREQALLVFDAVAATPGIVGVTARFAKARLALRYDGT